jgi:plasmid maintenance system killer protein
MSWQFTPTEGDASRLEKLKGDRANTYGIRINDQWRICFRWTNAGPEDRSGPPVDALSRCP